MKMATRQTTRTVRVVPARWVSTYIAPHRGGWRAETRVRAFGRVRVVGCLWCVSASVARAAGRRRRAAFERIAA